MIKPAVPTTDGMEQALIWFKEEIVKEMDAKIALHGGGSSTALEGVAVDGEIQPVKNKIAILGLSAYIKKTELSSGYHYKGSVSNFSDLPKSGQEEGDMYNILTTGGNDMNGDPVKAGDNVAWTGRGWDVLSGMVDLSNCVMKIPGKDLSSNDFTNAEKAKLAGLSNAAQYTLPTASTTTKGGFKVGTGLSMNGDTLNCTVSPSTTYALPTASTSIKGAVKVGHGLQMQGETLNATATSYVLPTATSQTKGGIKVGTGLTMNGDSLETAFQGYTLPTASSTTKGGVKVGAGLAMNGDSLEATVKGYTLPTASTTTKGGFKVGAGLSMAGDTLSVTLQTGIGDPFEGASNILGGTSGLVPSPAAGDNTKFLRGDGIWAPAIQNITVVGGDVTVSPNPQTFDGALWEDTLDNGEPCLKMRYGDYEFNFKYDTKNYTGTTPAPVSPEDAQLYMLDTVPSTDEGTLWYNVTQSTYFPIPALCLHAGNFDYGYNYDTITYKGGNTGLVSYLPLQNNISDAMGNATSSQTTPTFESFKIGSTTYRGLKNVDSSSTGSKSTTNKQCIITLKSSLATYTIDFWMTITTTLPGNSSFMLLNYTSGSQTFQYYTSDSHIQVVGGKPHAYGLTPGSRYHVALTKPSGGSGNLFINGVPVTEPFGSSSTAPLAKVNLFNNPYGTGLPSPIYIDHLRIWNKIVWDGAFEVPAMSSY